MASCCVFGPCVCVPVGAPWAAPPAETAQELEAYKERLELEIRQLEHRIRRLRKETETAT